MPATLPSTSTRGREESMTKRISERTSTTRIALMAPTQITPRVASIARANSIRLKRSSSTRPRTSSREIEAMTSTAASAAIGT
ncbi:hypothetical protein D3C78_1768980 [compost metagenome]